MTDTNTPTEEPELEEAEVAPVEASEVEKTKAEAPHDTKETAPAGTKKQEEQPDETVEFDGSEVDFLAAAGVDISDDKVQEAILDEKLTLREMAEQFGDKEKLAALLAKEPAKAESKEASEKKAEESDSPKKETPKAIRYKPNEREAEILQLAKEHKLDIVDAVALYNATRGEASTDKPEKKEDAAPKEAAASPRVADAEKAISDIVTQIQDLEGKLKVAEDDLEFTEANKLTRQITQLEIAKARAEDKRDAEARSIRQDFEAAEAKSGAVATAKYPKLGESGSMEQRAFTQYINERSEADPNLLTDSSWPERLADEFAESVGMEAKRPTPSEDGKPQTRKQPGTTKATTRSDSRSRLLDGGNGGPSAPPPANESNTMSDEEIDKVFEEIALMPPSEQARANKILFGKGFKLGS